jgi:hypothetical protein
LAEGEDIQPGTGDKQAGAVGIMQLKLKQTFASKLMFKMMGEHKFVKVEYVFLMPNVGARCLPTNTNIYPVYETLAHRLTETRPIPVFRYCIGMNICMITNPQHISFLAIT